MYLICTKNDYIIAYTDNLLIAEIYINNYNKDSEDNSAYYKKISNKKFKKILENKPYLIDRELVEYHKTYIPLEFLEYIQLSSNFLVEDEVSMLKLLVDMVYKREDITDKDRKTLYKAYIILKELYNEDGSYTPNIGELNRIKNYYDEYKYKIE